MFRRKRLAQFAAENEEETPNDGLKLSLFDLLCIGIGGTVGSGVFVLTGEVLPLAGPSSYLCWIFGGAVCLLSALSYCELATRVPTRGSCYAYSYHALGELAAVAGATSLTLEYGLSGAGIARSWSSKFAELFAGVSSDGVDYGAAGIQVASVLVVAAGAQLSTRVINVFTVAKVALVVFMIVAAFLAGEKGLAPHQAAEKTTGGLITGTSLVFFGFIGFDEVVCMASRASDPRRALPRAIIGTLAGASLLSCLAQLALTRLIIPDSDKRSTSFEEGFQTAGWPRAQKITQIGEVLLLPLVVILSFLPQPELCAALSHDCLLPARFAVQRHGVYGFGCATTGVALTVVALLVPFNVLWNMINLGVLVGFNLSNASLISLRVGNAGTVRDPRGDRLLAVFLVVTPASAYILWKGVGQPALDAAVVSKAAASIGGLLLVASLATLKLISLRCKIPLEEEAAEDNTTNKEDTAEFRAPFVPWLPGFAILLNSALMAQYGWADHGYLSGLYAAAYAAYFASKLFGGKQKKRKPTEDDDDSDQYRRLETPLLLPENSEEPPTAASGAASSSEPSC